MNSQTAMSRLSLLFLIPTSCPRLFPAPDVLHLCLIAPPLSLVYLACVLPALCLFVFDHCDSNTSFS